MRVVEKFAPEEFVKQFPDEEPWITTKIENLITKRSIIFQKRMKNPSAENQ